MIRNYWMIRALGARYALDLLTADGRPRPVPNDFARACRSVTICPRPRGIAGRAWKAAEALRPGGSYYVAGNVTRALRKRAAARAAAGPSFAMLDIAMCAALPGGVPYIYNAHNCESALMRRRAQFEPLAARGALLLEAARLERVERRFIKRAFLVAACSDADRHDLLRLAPEAGEKILVVPNGVDVARYESVPDEPEARGTLLLTGSFDWRPNRAGLQWFLSEVLPLLHAGPDPVMVRVAGRMSPALANSLARLAGVEAVANPASMSAELARADVVGAPILASSGTRLRILEAWAAGRPVVTTAAGAFGLEVDEGGDILLADEPAEFAAAVRRVIADRALWRTIQAAGRARASAYDWLAIGSAFTAELSLRLAALPAYEGIGSA